MFNFGNTNGAIEAALVAAGMTPMKVTPAVWKKALGCTPDKDQALALASQLIPQSTAFWTPKRGVQTKEDCVGVCEAALIAYWGAHHKLGFSLVENELPRAA